MVRTYQIAFVILVVALTSACAKPVPKPAGGLPGTPHVSWVLMFGDRDNADREFSCQSDPHTDCVLPASKPDAQVFSDIHFYFHGAGAETKYEGTINIGYLQGAPELHTSRTNITVEKSGTITNSSTTGIVTATPGAYTVTISLTATISGPAKTQPISQSIPVVVK